MEGAVHNIKLNRQGFTLLCEYDSSFMLEVEASMHAKTLFA